MARGNISFLVFVCFLSCILVSAKRPHIVFIVADDLGFNDVGFRNPDMITPNIDKLANEGVIFDSAYVLPVCSPSRSAFMSGIYPFKTGLQHIVIGPAQNVCLPLNLTILPQQLKKVGYATHIIGKWHLGFCNWNCTPTYRGFDSYLGYYNADEDYYKHTIGGFYDLHENETPGWNFNGKYSAYFFAERAQHIITNHSAEQPLFLYLPFQNVHAPIEVPPKYANMYPYVRNWGRQNFCGMVTILDEAIGNITQTLKDKGMYEDTLILFTADNGAELIAYGNNWPLRGGKHTLWEGGTRVTSFMSGYGLQETGITHTGILHAVDWMPTLIGAAGAEQVPGIDGINQWDSIRLNQPSKRTEFIYNLDDFYIPTQGHAGIRMGDWKLLLGYPGSIDGWYEPMNDTKDTPLTMNIFPNTGDSPARLFNVIADPRELKDLAADFPDIVQNLTARINEYRQSYVKANYPKPLQIAVDKAKQNGGVWSPGWC
ncbi:hypothetical protein SNE40_014641 [Patella caerulea]|uniref:Sulfatase N-terminal domain-containing protein n=1 Tax=Patella caerulea TaxID=87958 RepID=A0AAN8PHM8_PATCE